MGRMNKIVSSLVLFLCLVITIIIFLFQSTKLKTKGHYNIKSLSTEVDVYFDQYGIPHINAENARDAYKTLGFIMASERLFQLELMRRVVSGKLSEVFGNETLDVDILSRKLMLKKNAEDFLKRPSNGLSTEAISYMQAYIDGIHSFIKTESLPVEFKLLGFEPGPFEVADMLGFSSYMALGFSEGLTADVLFSELMESLPEDKMKIIRIGSEVDKDYFNPNKVVRSKFMEGLHSTIDKINSYVPLFHGSNSWVLSGARTKSGKALLANDPHISTSNPHIFYEAHMKYPGFEVYGHFIPLSPFPVLGHTPFSAWALTMAEVDDATVYLEKINPENPKQVMFKNEWVDMDIHTEEIKVKGQNKYTVSIYKTPHGVLLDGTKFGVTGKNLAFHWSAFHPENNTAQSFFELPFAKTVEEFKTAVSHAASPGLNISWVNQQGDIAWWVMGKFPKLPKGVPYDLVLNGWDGTHEVERYYTFEENPHQVNPQSGVIISANYKPQPEEFSHFDGYWQPGGRYFRLKELLSKKEKWDVKGLMQIQTDSIVPMHKMFKEKINLGLEQSGFSKREQEAYKILMNWNGSAETDQVGASIFFLLHYYLGQNIFLDELGPDNLKKFSRSADNWHAFKKLLIDQKHSFWDDIHTNRVEAASEIITKSFVQTVAELTSRFGENTINWGWGNLHTATYKHVLGAQWPLNLIYDLGPVPANGGRFVINNQGHRVMTDDFAVVHSPATRRIVEMKNPRKSYGVIPTGNSGNPFSDFFSDQIQLFQSGKYRSQTMDWQELKKRPLLKFKSN